MESACTLFYAAGCDHLSVSQDDDDDDDEAEEGEAMEAESDEESWVSCSSGNEEDAESVAVSEVLFFGANIIVVCCLRG